MSKLDENFLSLDLEVQQALLGGNTVVIAGPGGGKTRILTVKIGMLLSSGQNVACLSYSNATADKVRTELAAMGIDYSSAFIGTVHSFCLQYVVRPYVHLVPDYHSMPEAWSIASSTQCVTARSKAIQNLYGYIPNDKKLKESEFELTRLRRQRVYDPHFDWRSDRHGKLLAEYGKILVQQLKVIDFEMATEMAVNILRKLDWVREHISYKFDWVIVDEYQDLGGSLHALIVCLLKAGLQVVAVGDPNQIIYPDTGATSLYLDELISQQEGDFSVIRLKKCYRFGTRLIAASRAALGDWTENTAYEAGETIGDWGEIYDNPVGSTPQEQAQFIADTIIPKLLSLSHYDAQKDFFSIAILYAEGGEFVDALRNALKNLEEQGITYIDERHTKFPNSPLIDWLRKCADYTLIEDSSLTTAFSDLYAPYKSILCDADLCRPDEAEPESMSVFNNTLEEHRNWKKDADQWLISFCEALNIRGYLEQAGNHTGEIQDLDFLINEVSQKPVSILGFGSNQSKVVLTTIHSSKGREFDHVIIVGVQNGIIPWIDAQTGRPVDVKRFRNLFYVACTRARKSLHFVYSNRIKLRSRFWLDFLGPSDFINDVNVAVNEFDQALN